MFYFSITAITCIFFTAGHHHNRESLARRAAILILIKTFTLDLLDTIDLLDVLFETAIKHEVSSSYSTYVCLYHSITKEDIERVEARSLLGRFGSFLAFLILDRDKYAVKKMKQTSDGN